MNILRKIVKETLLVPYRLAQGAADAMSEVANDKPGKNDKKG